MSTLLVVAAAAPVGDADPNVSPALQFFLLVQVALPALWGFLVPFLVETVVKAYAPEWLRTALTAILTAGGGVVATISLTGLDQASWVAYGSAILSAWLVAGRVYLANLTDPVARATADIGVGSSSTAVRQ